MNTGKFIKERSLFLLEVYTFARWKELTKKIAILIVFAIIIGTVTEIIIIAKIIIIVISTLDSETISEISEIGFDLSLPLQEPVNTASSMFGNYSSMKRE